MKPKLTPALRKMLDRIRRATDRDGALLKLSVVAESGSAVRALNKLLDAGWIEHIGHPTIRVAGTIPASAVRVTEAGRAALAVVQGGRVVG